MPTQIIIKPKGLVPKTTARQRQRLITAVMAVIARQWHQRYSAFKFTPAAARKYSAFGKNLYARRKTKNIRQGTPRKSKSGRLLAPDGRPLTWTGTSKALASAANRKIQANSKRSKVTSPIRVFNFWPNRNNPNLNLRLEYTFVAPDEDKQLGNDAEKFARALFKSNKKNISISTF